VVVPYRRFGTTGRSHLQGCTWRYFVPYFVTCRNKPSDVPTLLPRSTTKYLTYLLIYLLTYPTEQSPSCEANRFSASQEIPFILWTPKVHYRIHKFPPPVPMLSQLDPVNTPTYHFLKIRLSILSSHLCLGLPSGLFPSGFPTKTLYTPLFPRTCYLPRPSHYEMSRDAIRRPDKQEVLARLDRQHCTARHAPCTLTDSVCLTPWGYVFCVN
jgi:hypothetical protein